MFAYWWLIAHTAVLLTATSSVCKVIESLVIVGLNTDNYPFNLAPRGPAMAVPLSDCAMLGTLREFCRFLKENPRGWWLD